MKNGDKIIWDSGYGYELGTFISEDSPYNTYEINLTTGITANMNSTAALNIGEISPYSEDLEHKMIIKYKF